MSNKPLKILYENQNEVHDVVLKFLNNLLEELDCQVYLVGSASNLNFGKYVDKYGVHEASDIDLVVFIKKQNIPENWKYLNIEKSWWNLYRVAKLEFKGIVHIAEAMVVKEGFEKFAIARMKELGWTPEKIK